MTELLDAFDDAGVERETVEFLLEALANSDDPDTWSDILEPFLPPEQALSVLRSVPGVLERALALLRQSQAERERERNLESEFLSILKKGVFHYADCHTLARWARLCRTARAVAGDDVWEPRARLLYSRWVPQRRVPLAWRDAFFGLLRPRHDGVYVAECGYQHYIQFGCNLSLQENGREFKGRKMGAMGFDKWYDYRRYVRFFVPDSGELRVAVLQHAGARELALQVLLSIDPATHQNPAALEPVGAYHQASEDRGSRQRDIKAEMQERVCVGSYELHSDAADSAKVHFEFTTGEGQFRAAVELLQGGERRFSSRLEWLDYTQSGRQGEVNAINLGRKYYSDGSKVEGSPPADESKDHFAAFVFQDLKPLHHLL